ncbi:MAG: hypothetical protein U5N55_13680 [Cypionkella sp.]|nr:hypothetical protein [Cypionkella sp.]
MGNGRCGIRWCISSLIALLLLSPVDVGFYLTILLIINAYASHLHLWSAIRATLIKNGETWRVKFIFYFILIVYSVTINLIAFQSSLDPKETVKLIAILFLAPLMLMGQAYMKLAKGANE